MTTEGLGNRCNRQSGIALVLVLWMLVLLTTIANSLSFSSRTDVIAAGNLAAQARAEALADAAVHRAIHQLASASNTSAQGAPHDPTRWKADGLVRTWRYEDAEMRVSIIGEAGKIDINTAPPPLLAGLFRSVGLEQGMVEALVDAILDWRDEDELRRPNGAERSEYAAAGLQHGPANADFMAIDELQQLLGMTSTLFKHIEPLITVHSRQAGIDTATAPRDVLLALPNTTPEQVDSYISQRIILLEQGLPAPPFAPAQGFSTGTSAGAFSIQVEAVLSDNARFSRQAVVRLTGSPSEPVSFLAWRAPSLTSDAPTVRDVDHDG